MTDALRSRPPPQFKVFALLALQLPGAPIEAGLLYKKYVRPVLAAHKPPTESDADAPTEGTAKTR